MLPRAQGDVLPILRAYACPQCATGDAAHTAKYCPNNKDGKFNCGRSLTDLKKLRNAAGRIRLDSQEDVALAQGTGAGLQGGNREEDPAEGG